MQETLARLAVAAAATILFALPVGAQTRIFDNSVDRSCVATEHLKQETRIAALPASVIPGYQNASAELHGEKETVFKASAQIEQRRTDAAWQAASDILRARPSLLDRIKRAVLFDHPQLKEGGEGAQAEFNRLFYEYARVDPELLRAVNGRLQYDGHYDGLLAETLKIGDRIDELEGRQIELNEAIPVHWDQQEKAALRAARAFAAKAKAGHRLLQGSGKNAAMTQAMAVAGALEAQARGSLPTDFRAVQAEGVIIKGSVVGLAMPKTRAIIRKVDSIIRRGELRLSHVDTDKLGSAEQRAAMQSNPARRQTLSAAQQNMGKGLHELMMGDLLSRQMRGAPVPKPPDLAALPVGERKSAAAAFVQVMETALENKAGEVGVTYDFVLRTKANSDATDQPEKE